MWWWKYYLQWSKNGFEKLKPDYEIDIFHSGCELLNSNVTYDLIFLDIEMPDINGMKTAESLRNGENEEHIIFLTSHTEFMPDAFKVKAFRFLNKPIETETFEEAVVEAEKEILNNEKIAITFQGNTKLVRLKEILCFEAFGDGTYIYTKKEVLESKKSLKYWMNEIEMNISIRCTNPTLHLSDISKNWYYRNTTAPLKTKYTCIKKKVAAVQKSIFEYIKKNAKYIWREVLNEYCVI